MALPSCLSALVLMPRQRWLWEEPGQTTCSLFVQHSQSPGMLKGGHLRKTQEPVVCTAPNHRPAQESGAPPTALFSTCWWCSSCPSRCSLSVWIFPVGRWRSGSNWLPPPPSVITTLPQVKTNFCRAFPRMALGLSILNH